MSSRRTTRVTTTKKRSASAGPRATRPRMPKDYGVPKTQRGMLPWATTKKILEDAKSYWLVTTDLESKPHLGGPGGAVIDDRRYVLGGQGKEPARSAARQLLMPQW